MTLESIPEAEIRQFAREMFGPKIEEAKDAAIQVVTERIEGRIVEILERISEIEKRLNKSLASMQADITAQAVLLSKTADREELIDYAKTVDDRFADLEKKIDEVNKWQSISKSVLEHFDGLNKNQEKLAAEFERLRDGALNRLLDEVREQAKERDRTLYRRIEELAAGASAEIKAEKKKMLSAFREMTRMMDERSQKIRELDDKVRQKLISHGEAYQALLREFEALKAGVRIGKGK